jgi:hypothetical protein
MSSDQKSSDQMNSDQMNLDLWSILIKTKQVVSQLPFARTLLVCVWSWSFVLCCEIHLSHAWSYDPKVQGDFVASERKTPKRTS